MRLGIMLKKIDVVFLLMISLFSIVVGLLDFFGVIGSLTWLSTYRIQSLSLVFLSLLGFHFIMKATQDEGSKKLLNQILSETELLLTSCNTVITKEFPNSAELESYVSERIRNAKEEVLDLTWKKSLSGEELLPKRKTATKKYDNSIKKISKDLAYKEIFILDQYGRKEKLKRRLLENSPGYSCAYFQPCEVPRIQFIIIDKKEILFVSSSYGIKSAFYDEKLVTIFRNYFFEAWHDAIKIKEANQLNSDVIKSIYSDAEFENLKNRLRI